MLIYKLNKLSQKLYLLQCYFYCNWEAIVNNILNEFLFLSFVLILAK